MTTNNVTLILAMAALLGCREPSSVQVLEEPVSDPNSSVAYLLVEPANGDTIALRARVRTGAKLGPIGSFAFAIRFDSSTTVFVDAEALRDGLRVHNATVPGIVRVAGAAAQGLPGPDLFAGRFVTTASDLTSAFSLEVSELSGATFRDLEPTLRVVHLPINAPGLIDR